MVVIDPRAVDRVVEDVLCALLSIKDSEGLTVHFRPHSDLSTLRADVEALVQRHAATPVIADLDRTLRNWEALTYQAKSA